MGRVGRSTIGKGKSATVAGGEGPIRFSVVRSEYFEVLKDGFNKRILKASPDVFVAVVFRVTNRADTSLKPTAFSRALVLRGGAGGYLVPQGESRCAAASEAYGVQRPKIDYPGQAISSGDSATTAAVFVVPRRLVARSLRLTFNDGTSFAVPRPVAAK
jgi:hypothetical protein